MGGGVWIQLTLRRRHLFSLMAPRQPRKPVTMTMVPMAMTRLAADSEGKLGEKVAKLPWDTDSQMPTPSSPQPQSWRERKAVRSAPFVCSSPRTPEGCTAPPPLCDWVRGERGCGSDVATGPHHVGCVARQKLRLSMFRFPGLANGITIASQTFSPSEDPILKDTGRIL